MLRQRLEERQVWNNEKKYICGNDFRDGWWNFICIGLMGRYMMINILVVEDDIKLNQIVCTYLNDSGFHAKSCLSAKEAYDEMYNSLYELIISDIMMPEIDGFEFAQTVRQVNQTIPILFMSAKDDLPSKQRGFQLGIDDYMVKPVELDELLLRVKAFTQGKYRNGTQDYRGKSGIGRRWHECGD